jgi:hypothetical protein
VELLAADESTLFQHWKNRNRRPKVTTVKKEVSEYDDETEVTEDLEQLEFEEETSNRSSESESESESETPDESLNTSNTSSKKSRRVIEFDEED